MMNMNKLGISISLFSMIIGTGILVGCYDEIIPEPPTPTPNAQQIQLLIPDAEKVTVYSEATVRENYIDNCYVITFNSSSALKEWEKIDVSRIVRNGQATSLLPSLNIEIDAGDRVYVICNIDTAFARTNIGGLVNESNINTVFRPAKDYYFGGDALPMSGSIDSWSLTSYTVTLIRAVAKVTVQLGETFELSIADYEEHQYPSGYHYGFWDPKDFYESEVGFIIGNYGGASNILQNPNPNILSQNIVVPNLSYYATATEGRVIRFTQHAKKEREMSFYISEYPSRTRTSSGGTVAEDDWDKQRQYILMMPGMLEDSNEEYYQKWIHSTQFECLAWRLDFIQYDGYDAVNKKHKYKYLDIRRNHHYTFVINKIKSLPYAWWDDGTNTIKLFGWHTENYGDPHDAMTNHGSNIEYLVRVNEDWANHTYSNGQYALSISADTITNLSVFRLKIQVPPEYAGDPSGNAGPGPCNCVRFYDNLGNMIGHQGSWLQVSDDYINTGFIAPLSPYFPIPSPVTKPNGITFYFLSLPNVHLNNGGYIEIWYGNLYKKVPFNVEVML